MIFLDEKCGVFLEFSSKLLLLVPTTYVLEQYKMQRFVFITKCPPL